MKTDPALAIDLICNTVQQRYVDDPSQQAPMVFAFKNGQVATIIALDFDSDQSKSESIAEARRLISSQRMDASVFVSEAWMIEQPASELAAQLRPRDSERRVECLIVEASARGRSLSVIYKIERDWSNKFMGLQEYQRYDSLDKNGDAQVQSRFDFFN